jgi:hypothetical protein
VGGWLGVRGVQFDIEQEVGRGIWGVNISLQFYVRSSFLRIQPTVQKMVIDKPKKIRKKILQRWFTVQPTVQKWLLTKKKKDKK